MTANGMVKRTNLKRTTLKKSEALFHEERISPFTLNLKATLYSVSLYKKCNWSELLFFKEQKEQKEQIPDFLDLDVYKYS